MNINDFNKAVNSIRDGEYAHKESEQAELLARGQSIIAHAYAQGIITLAEYHGLMESSTNNGTVIVSPAMMERLKKLGI